MSCEFVSCEVCLLLNSRDERDLYVANCCAADMSREAFVKHLSKSILLAHKSGLMQPGIIFVVAFFHKPSSCLARIPAF